MLLCQIIVSLPRHDKKGDGGMGQGKTSSKIIQQIGSRGTMTWHVSLQPGSHQWLSCLSVWQGENHSVPMCIDGAHLLCVYLNIRENKSSEWQLGE